MIRSEFARAAREQNDRRDIEICEARRRALPCDVETMLAFGGTPYCRSHGVMGPCPYGGSR
jgi:hypothetical protein